MTTFCPATMCPLFAPNGSPWTGEVNTPCAKSDCDYYDTKASFCFAGQDAFSFVEDAKKHGDCMRFSGPKDLSKIEPQPAPTCDREHECEWQRTASPGLCAPRYAITIGVDPRACCW